MRLAADSLAIVLTNKPASDDDADCVVKDPKTVRGDLHEEQVDDKPGETASVFGLDLLVVYVSTVQA